MRWNCLVPRTLQDRRDGRQVAGQNVVRILVGGTVSCGSGRAAWRGSTRHTSDPKAGEVLTVRLASCIQGRLDRSLVAVATATGSPFRWVRARAFLAIDLNRLPQRRDKARAERLAQAGLRVAELRGRCLAEPSNARHSVTYDESDGSTPQREVAESPPLWRRLDLTSDASDPCGTDAQGYSSRTGSASCWAVATSHLRLMVSIVRARRVIAALSSVAWLRVRRSVKTFSQRRRETWAGTTFRARSHW